MIFFAINYYKIIYIYKKNYLLKDNKDNILSTYKMISEFFLRSYILLFYFKFYQIIIWISNNNIFYYKLL